jgi:ubiquinone/menaquinone biosynthesis C-methylase UbiE
MYVALRPTCSDVEMTRKDLLSMRHLWPFHRTQRQESLNREPIPSSLSLTFHDEEGRRHRTDAPYLLPKDDQELQRLDYQHYIFRHILQGNTFAPVDARLKKGGNVLDVGCGTGRWGCEIASLYQQTRVIGLDLEDIAHSAALPRNVQFQRGNVLTGLPFAAQQFLYVHQRLLIAGIPLAQWPFVIRDLQRVTALGGWVELVEMGTQFHQTGAATQQFLTWFAAISQTRGIDASNAAQIGTFLHEAGFSQVKAKTDVIPVGKWGGRIGNLLAQDILAGWPSMRPLAHTLLGVPPAQFDAVIGQLETEWNTLQTTYEVYFACGQR